MTLSDAYRLTTTERENIERVVRDYTKVGYFAFGETEYKRVT